MFIWNVSPMTPPFSRPVSSSRSIAWSIRFRKYVSYRFQGSSETSTPTDAAYWPPSRMLSIAHFRSSAREASGAVFITADGATMIVAAPAAAAKSATART